MMNRLSVLRLFKCWNCDEIFEEDVTEYSYVDIKCPACGADGAQIDDIGQPDSSHYAER